MRVMLTVLTSRTRRMLPRSLSSKDQTPVRTGSRQPKSPPTAIDWEKIEALLPSRGPKSLRGRAHAHTPTA